MKIALSHTVRFEGQSIKELALPEYLSVGMSLEIQKLEESDSPVEQNIATMAVICGMPKEFIKLLPTDDYETITEHMNRLAESSSKKNSPRVSGKRNRSKKAHKNTSC